MQGFRITKEAVKNHFHYGKWIYIGIAVALGFLCEMLLSTTAYRPPADHKVDIQLVGMFYSAEPLQALADAMMQDAQAIDPVLEEISVSGIAYSGDAQTDMYGAMNFQVKLGAQVGDVYILPTDIARQLVALGGCQPLDALIDAGLLDADRALKLLPDPMAVQEEEGPAPTPYPDVVNALSLAGLDRLRAPDIAFDSENACAIVAPGAKNQELAAKVLTRLIDSLEAGDPK